jgi:hypothetical protein
LYQEPKEDLVFLLARGLPNPSKGWVNLLGTQEMIVSLGSRISIIAPYIYHLSLPEFLGKDCRNMSNSQNY